MHPILLAILLESSGFGGGGGGCIWIHMHPVSAPVHPLKRIFFMMFT